MGEKFGLRGLVVRVGAIQDLEPAFQALSAFQAQAIFVANDAFFGDIHSQIVELLLRSRLASVWEEDGPVQEGALMSYGPPVDDNFRRVAHYVDKILRGEKASDLPIEQPTKLRFVINRKTAAALGLRIPQAVLLQADQVID
jgi:putative ABC transport system substrate-binding protein